MKNGAIVIASAKRTAMGNFQGAFSALSAADLGGHAIRAAVAEAGLSPEDITEVLMGCVLQAGLGQAPARQAAFKAGLPQSAPATAVNKVCGSGMKTVMMAYEALHARPNEIIAAGGMESMTNAPYLLPKGRGGLRLGHGEIKDHMFLDGLEDAYDGRLMGTYAEDTAEHYQFTREAQDAYAVESLRRAKQANLDGSFASEITPVPTVTSKGGMVIDRDERPFIAKPEKIPQLKPVFRAGGTVTAANSSPISDGAAALIVMRESEAGRRGIQPLARIAGCASHAQAPAWFTTAPAGAINKLFDLTGWRQRDVGLYEINEAFAVGVLASMQGLGLSHAEVNVHGGACALGHPIGASGARIIVTLLTAMRRHGVKRGCASICIGGGEATAIALEIC